MVYGEGPGLEMPFLQKAFVSACFVLQGVMCAVLSHSVVSDSATPRTVAFQAHLSMGFSKQEYWSGFVSQEAGQVVWYSHLFQNFPQFNVIHTVKSFGIVNKAEIELGHTYICIHSLPNSFPSRLPHSIEQNSLAIQSVLVCYPF